MSRRLLLDDQGPYLLVALDKLGQVRECLRAAGISFQEDPDASATCAGPVIGVFRFPRAGDREELERALEEAGLD